MCLGSKVGGCSREMGSNVGPVLRVTKALPDVPAERYWKVKNVNNLLREYYTIRTR